MREGEREGERKRAVSPSPSATTGSHFQVLMVDVMAEHGVLLRPLLVVAFNGDSSRRKGLALKPEVSHFIGNV